MRLAHGHDPHLSDEDQRRKPTPCPIPGVH
ncbi:MAG: hypothetical protein QOG66_1332, partial [Methylobacteriaceae bacterium]|nr:hypothetical protein [Methylobacteriaceae bacterium]